MLLWDPCVFAVGEDYQIVFDTAEPGIAWVTCGGQAYRDSEGELMRSDTVHRVALPMAALEGAGSYEVCFRALAERRAYFPEPGPLYSRAFAFHPLPEDCPVRAVMLADTHSMIEEPCRAAAAAGPFDLMLLCGDIPAESAHLEDLRAIHAIGGALTHGALPVVFARGNHDYRGRFATELPRFVGNAGGATWFTFRLGALWGIALDCGEDKSDDDPEYGGMVDCHAMRLRETEFIKQVVARAEREYLAEGVRTRIALCHIPFCTAAMGDDGGKFDIERTLYAEWTALLNGMGLDAMFSGHTHALETVLPGGERARYGMNFPVIIGAKPVLPSSRDPQRPRAFTGVRMAFGADAIQVDTIGDDGRISPMAQLPRRS